MYVMRLLVRIQVIEGRDYFEHAGKFYCEDDYIATFGKFKEKCPKCLKALTSGEVAVADGLVRKCRDIGGCVAAQAVLLCIVFGGWSCIYICICICIVFVFVCVFVIMCFYLHTRIQLQAFHEACFVCNKCNSPFQDGKYNRSQSGAFYCQKCFRHILSGRA